MILMWLVPVAVMIGGLVAFRVGVSQILGSLQSNFLKLPTPTSTLKMLAVTKLCAVGMGGFLQNQYSAVALMNSRRFSRHYSILLLCISGAGLWTTMLAMTLIWKVNGSWLFGASFFVYLYNRWSKTSSTCGLGVFNMVVGLGSLLVGAQWALEKQAILMSTLGESDLHFLLADGRFPAQMLWMAVAFVLTLIISVESWATLLALVLLGAGSLSLNGAAAVIVGELLAHVWSLWWRSRKLNQDVKESTRSFALASTLGLGIAFFVVGYVRDLFAWNMTFDGDLLTEKSLQLLVILLVLVVIQSLTAMLWGHFAARNKVDEIQKGEYFSVRWISQGLIGKNILEFILQSLKERSVLLVQQKQDLNTSERAQIPKTFLLDHDQEIVKLAMWLPLAENANSSMPQTPL